MFNRSDLNALLITAIIILLGYASMHLLVGIIACMKNDINSFLRANKVKQ